MACLPALTAPGNTMNQGITCANVFGAASINSIVAHRNTINCLEACGAGVCGNEVVDPGEQCDPPNGFDCDANCQIILTNDDCVDATDVPCTTSVNLNNSNATPAQNDGGPGDPQIPAGSPSCQWNGVPTDTHNTVWYSFVAQDTSIDIQTCTTTAVQDTILALYSGTCGNLTQIGCSEDVCGASTWESRICAGNLTPST